jgi:hypothetical protein
MNLFGGSAGYSAPLQGELARHHAAAARSRAAKLPPGLGGAIEEERRLRRTKRLLAIGRLLRVVR